MPLRMVTSKKQMRTKSVEDMGKEETLAHSWWACILVFTMEISVEVSQKTLKMQAGVEAHALNHGAKGAEAGGPL